MLFSINANASGDYELVRGIRAHLHSDLVYKASQLGPDRICLDNDYTQALEQLQYAIQRYDNFMKTYHAEKGAKK